MVWVSLKENMKKKSNQLGETNNNAKLTVEIVKEIKKLLKKKMTVKELAEKYEVSESAIRGIKYGLTWKHVK